MAGLPWFALASDFPTHPKTVRLALRLKDQNAGMYVVRLLAFCAQHVPTGRLDGEAVESIIATACEWKKRPEVLVDALVGCGWLEHDGDGYNVHGWAERNGAHVRKRERDARKPRGNKEGQQAEPATVPQRSRAGRKRDERGTDAESAEVPHEASAGEGEGERQIQEATAAAAAAPEVPLPASAAAAQDDEFRQPFPGTEDLSGVDSPPTWQAAKDFRSLLEAKLLIGGGRFNTGTLQVQDWADLDRLVVSLGGPELAATWCAEKAKDRKSGSKRITSLAWFLRVMQDELRPVERTEHPELLSGPDLLAEAIAREAASCPDWAAVLEQLGTKLRRDLVLRWMAPLRGARANGTLTLRSPDAFHAEFIRDQYQGHLNELAQAVLHQPVHVEVTA